MMGDVFREVVRVLDAGGKAALATIMQTHGSTPGKEAMKLLVREDGSFVGTVGGGCLEAEVWEVARQVMCEDLPRKLRFQLNERDYPESGLLCGGMVEVYVEPIGAPAVFLFGGGHISQSIARAARQAGFRVVVADDRPEFAERTRFPDADAVHCAPFDVVVERLPIRRDSFCVVVTRGHKHDGVVLRSLAGKPQRYTGMIGSESKARIVYKRLRAQGVAAAWLQDVHCPIGLSIGARTHDEIAISVVAELIAVRRGATRSTGNTDPWAGCSEESHERLAPLPKVKGGAPSGRGSGPEEPSRTTRETGRQGSESNAKGTATIRTNARLQQDEAHSG